MANDNVSTMMIINNHNHQSFDLDLDVHDKAWVRICVPTRNFLQHSVLPATQIYTIRLHKYTNKFKHKHTNINVLIVIFQFDFVPIVKNVTFFQDNYYLVITEWKRGTCSISSSWDPLRSQDPLTHTKLKWDLTTCRIKNFTFLRPLNPSYPWHTSNSTN